jgi:hypothetical protein
VADKYIYKNRKGFIFQKDGHTKYFISRVAAIAYRNEYLGYDPDVPETKQILVFDIETTPMKGYFFGVWQQNINLDAIEDDWYILSVAWRFLNQDMETLVQGLPTFTGYTGGNSTEKSLVGLLWVLLDGADIVVGHNATKFDVKRVQTKFVEYGLPKPSPFKIVDTLKIARQNFAFSSNKLDYIAKKLDVGAKVDHSGITLWLRCMEGDPEAWAEMLEYNKVDVDITIAVYEKIRGWDKSHPNVAVANDGHTCPTCGGRHLKPLAGEVSTGVNTYHAWQCGNCGQVVRGIDPTGGRQKLRLVR